MDDTILMVLLSVVFGAGALAMYLMLPGAHVEPTSIFRRIGLGLGLCSLVALGVLVGGPVDWWPQTSWATRDVALLLLAIVSFVAATAAVTARSPSRGRLWFAILLVSSAGLFGLNGAYIPAAVLIFFVGGGLAIQRRRVRHSTRDESTQQTNQTNQTNHAGHEPLLACLSGGLLALALVFAIHDALSSTSVRDPQTVRESVLGRRDSIQAAMNEHPKPLWIDTSRSHFNGLARALWPQHAMSLAVMAALLLVAAATAVQIVRGDGTNHTVDLPMTGSANQPDTNGPPLPNETSSESS